MKGQRAKTHVFSSILFKNTVFCDKRIRRPCPDLPLVKGLKARPDKENPGPTPFPGKNAGVSAPTRAHNIKSDAYATLPLIGPIVTIRSISNRKQ